MLIRPASPRAKRSLKSALTTRTRPSGSLLRSLPPRSVMSIAPSGVKARSQGMVSPERIVRTVSAGGSTRAPMTAPETHSAVFPYGPPSLPRASA